jgi:hypothetical protein
MLARFRPRPWGARLGAAVADEGRARLENHIARLLQELADPEAPLIDLMLIGVRQG